MGLLALVPEHRTYIGPHYLLVDWQRGQVVLGALGHLQRLPHQNKTAMVLSLGQASHKDTYGQEWTH